MVLRTKIASLVVALLFSGVLVQISAQAVVTPTTKQAEQAKYNTARTTWNSRNPQFYYYQITQECSGCAPLNYPWRQSVDRTDVRGIDSKGNLLPSPQDMLQRFARIQGAISGSESVFALYDPTYGFPTFYQIAEADGRTNFQLSQITVSLPFPTGSPRTLYTQNLAIWNQQNAFSYMYQYTDRFDTLNIAWPRTVTVQNTLVTTSSDANGNPTTSPNFPRPWTIPMYFQAIDRQISGNSPYMEVYYATNTGYPTTIGYIDAATRVPFWHDLGNFRQMA